MSTSKSLEDQIREKVRESGITVEDVEGGGPQPAGAVGAFDGSRIKKLIEFAISIWPLIKPLLNEPPTHEVT